MVSPNPEIANDDGAPVIWTNPIENPLGWLDELGRIIEAELTSLSFYTQAGLIVVALTTGYVASRIVMSRVALFAREPRRGKMFEARSAVYRGRALLTPAFCAATLGIAVALSGTIVSESWLVRIAQGAAVVFLIYRTVSHLVDNVMINRMLTWVGLPVALLYVFGWLGAVTTHLDSIAIELGDIRVTLLGIVRTLIFGAVLFWLGRISNATGQRVIRGQQALDAATREIAAKLFQIALFVFILVMLLQIMGIDITALVVFGGAIGVGLGFGLQQIAANFISGIIILIDRTITINDYIELEDGRAGRLRELNMRSATLETFDGKDIMVPNERFITTAFVNWTHNNAKQRYSLNFSVAYNTDLEAMFDLVRDVVASHPKVLSGEHVPLAERPDAEIESFGDSGIDILVEFWMEGIDDGENRVGADLLLMIWTTLKANDIEIPFPQREVKILDGKPAQS